MANSSLSLTSLDFNTLKDNYKNYLKSQSIFKDYNFEASNMNVLLDVLSYNTYLNSFYLNMVAAEMFLDSAQKLDSVVSHAKELNYLPRSAKSSSATVSFVANTVSIPSPFTIPKGTKFSGSNANGIFTFTTSLSTNFVSATGVFNIDNLRIYEGQYVTDTFVIDYTVDGQLFTLTNPNIDIDSLEIVITESGANTTFTRADTLFGLDSKSNVYFIQAAHNGQYEILFGDGLFGRKPYDSAIITASYRVSNGDDADGITSFNLTDNLGALNGGSVSISEIIVNSESASGALQESKESIKFSAPRYFATQQRAVASDDYSALVLANFGGEIKDCVVYGGELLEPKQYGRVVICLKPAGGTIAPQYIKSRIYSYLKPYISLPSRIIITDPDYIYCQVITTVQYNSTETKKLADEIRGIVLNSIVDYSQDNLEQFGGNLRYSKLVKQIDDSDSSIKSNSTEVKIIKRIVPLQNYPQSFNIDYGNPTEVEPFDSTLGYVRYGALSDEPVFISSFFTYEYGGIKYSNCRFRDDNLGKIIVCTTINDVFTVINSNAGTINYNTGKVTLNSFIVSDYGAYIELMMIPMNRDIFVTKSQLLVVDPKDVTINVIETNR